MYKKKNSYKLTSFLLQAYRYFTFASKLHKADSTLKLNYETTLNFTLKVNYGLAFAC